MEGQRSLAPGGHCGSAQGHGGGGSLEGVWTRPWSFLTAGSARGAASCPSRPAPPSPAASAAPPRPSSGPPRRLPLWRRGLELGLRAASSSACVARRHGLELGPRGLELSGATGDGDELTAAAYGPRLLAALSLPPLPLPPSISCGGRIRLGGSCDQAAGPRAGCRRARRPVEREEARACAARNRRGVASPSGGEERAAGRMGSASRRPLVAGWTGTIFSDDVATLSFLLLVRKLYTKTSTLRAPWHA